MLQIDDILFVVKSAGAVSEIRSNGLNIRQKNQWVTIGDNDGPCHMHLNAEKIKTGEFVEEEKPERTSFSIMFFDHNKERVLGAFFTKMYDEDKNLRVERTKKYEDLQKKYGVKIKFNQKPTE